MNFKKLLLIPSFVLLALTNTSFVNANDGDIVVYTDDIYGPFYKGDGSDRYTLKLTYTYYGNHILEARERIRIKYHTEFSSVYIVNYQTDIHDLQNGKQYTYTYEFCPTSVINERFGCTFSFEVINLNFDVTLDYEERDVFFTSKDHTYDQAYIDELVVVNPIYSIFTLGKMKAPIEKYDFTNTQFHANESSGVYIDIRNIFFEFDAYEVLNYTKCYLKFYDYYGFFPDLERSYGYVYAPIRLRHDENKVFFDFVSLYVNPDTLEVSKTRYKGYKPCYRIYFPFAKLDKVQETTFQIIIEEIGIVKSTFIMDIDYYPTNNLIGDCYNSDFCITGGVES